MVLKDVQVIGGLRYNIPQYEKSYLEVSTHLETGGMLLAINLHADDLLDGDLRALPPQNLPGGRPLPSVFGGSLPAVAFTVESLHNMTFYLSKNIYGLFVPLHLDVDGAIATFKYYIGDKRAGTLSIVGADENGENSGVLLLINLDDEFKTTLKRLSDYY